MATQGLTIMPVAPPAGSPVAPIKTPDVSAFTAPTAPATSTTTTPNPNSPTFQDILNRLNKPADLSSSPLFQQAITASTPSGGISPQTQNILDVIKKQQQQSQAEGIAAAQSLAAKRGITGSSTEQFGTQQAIELAQRTGQDATTAALTNDLNQQNALKMTQVQGLFQGAGLQLQSNDDLNKLAATLTSDQIASLNNMDFQNRSLALQQLLGQQGIQAANANIAAQKDISKQNSQYGLAGSILQGATPFALAKLFAGTAGAAAIPAALGAGATVGGATGIAGGGLGLLAANPLSAYGAGSIGTGGATAATGAGIAGGAAVGAGLLGAGIGSMALDKYTNDKLDLSGRFGNSGGAVARTLLNPIGAPLNEAKNLISNPSATVNKALGGKQGEQMQGSLAWANGMSNSDVATNLGKPGMGVNYDSNSQGSAQRNWNTQLDQFTPDSLVARYSSVSPSQLGTAKDQAQYDAYQAAVKLNNGQPITGQQYSAYLKDNSHLVKAADIIDQVFA